MNLSSNKQGRRLVAVIFGGKSAEHAISLLSAKNIIQNLNKVRFETMPIAIDLDGNWWTADSYEDLVRFDKKDHPRLYTDTARELVLFPGKSFPIQAIDQSLPLPKIDVVFPIVHGPLGEDGSLQGLLRLLGLPFVGPDVSASAVGMDKVLMKRLLRDAGVPVGRFREFRATEGATVSAKMIDEIIGDLGLPLYVKPANMGSSIGISRVEKKGKLKPALKEALLYDRKLILESELQGRELECAVLGNEKIEASAIGEIVPAKSWYSFEAKYLDKAGARLVIPAVLTDKQKKQLQECALEAYHTLGLEGLSRVDLFLTESGEVFINEVNTLPGFTDISMFPKLWEQGGLLAGALLERLIELAIERHEKQAALLSKPY